MPRKNSKSSNPLQLEIPSQLDNSGNHTILPLTREQKYELLDPRDWCTTTPMSNEAIRILDERKANLRKE